MSTVDGFDISTLPDTITWAGLPSQAVRVEFGWDETDDLTGREFEWVWQRHTRDQVGAPVDVSVDVDEHTLTADLVLPDGRGEWVLVLSEGDVEHVRVFVTTTLAAGAVTADGLTGTVRIGPALVGTFTVLGHAGGGTGGGVTDHGLLTGLGDDDHPHYLTNARGDARYDPIGIASTLVAAHAGAADPHGDRAYAASLVAALTAGSPDDLNAFIEVYNRFLADESALAGLTTTVGTKLAKASNLSDVVDAAAALANIGGVAASVFTTDGDLLTRTGGVVARLTRAALAADTAFTNAFEAAGTAILKSVATAAHQMPRSTGAGAWAPTSTAGNDTVIGRSGSNVIGPIAMGALRAMLGPTGTPGAATYLRGDGAWASPLQLVPTAVKTGAYGAAAGEFVPVDTSGGAVTITFPTAPADGTLIAVKMVAGGNVVNLALGGSDVFTVAGGATTGSLTLAKQAILCMYRATGAIWYTIADDIPLSALDARFHPRYVVDTSANLAAANTVYARGVIVIASDAVPAAYKVGDGTTGFNALPWFRARTDPVVNSFTGAVLSAGTATSASPGDLTNMGSVAFTVASVPWRVRLTLPTWFASATADNWTIYLTDVATGAVFYEFTQVSTDAVNRPKQTLTIEARFTTPGSYNVKARYYRQPAGTGSLTLSAVAAISLLEAFAEPG